MHGVIKEEIIQNLKKWQIDVLEEGIMFSIMETNIEKFLICGMNIFKKEA